MKNPTTARILKEIAKEEKIKLYIEPENELTGYIEYPDKSRTYFKNSNLNLNPIASTEIARDKGYTKFYLKHFGYNTPEGQTFYSEKLNKHLKHKRDITDGWKYAEQLGLPVYIKPNNSAQGNLVTKINNKKEYNQAAKKILTHHPVMLLEKAATGKDYRILVLGKDVITTYQRTQLTITGNGTSTIQELIQEKQEQQNKKGRNSHIDINDYRIKNNLRKQKLNLRSVPKKRQQIQLLDNANLSTGGESQDVSHKTHPDYKKLAIEVTQKFNLTLCGVDILTNDISKPISKTNPYTILELNGTPGIEHYAASGKHEHEIAKNLYKKALNLIYSAYQKPRPNQL